MYVDRLFTCMSNVVDSWYYKGVSRTESEGILRNERKEGCFLVRDSSQKGMYTLSLFTMEK